MQRALLDSLNPVALRHFAPPMKATMYEALNAEDGLLGDGGQLLPLAAALAPKRESSRLRKLLESDQPLFAWVVAQLKEERPEIVPQSLEQRLMQKVAEQVRRQSAQAKDGSVSLGGRGPLIDKGRLLSVADKPERDLINLLIETATDPTLPPQYLTDARRALVLLRRSGRLTASDLRRLRRAPEPRDIGRFDEGMSAGAMRAWLLQAIGESLSIDEKVELVAAARSSEERVRAVAVNACAEALDQKPDEDMAWAVVSGLFDPSQDVAEGALSGLPALTANFKAPAEVAWQRLPEMFAVSARSVRSQILYSLQYAKPKTKRQRERRRALLIRGRQDRSWQVRTAALEVERQR